ncbi:sugar transferase [Nonlabens ponticola]|uniref:Sugar transferase n=1 Tax=Nonlabens ponticola TaxID=2496866 RepID=A0A3S9MZV9_9FLAO|nr:sugar transferase [Nonlabens ponticola]AZQ44688.1 sugar transferase [Nonlabens ponticola]
MYRSIVKPALDFAAAVFWLFILSPIFIIVTIVLFKQNDGKVFFTQLRPGKNGVLFKIMKFKTMNDKKDQAGNLLSDDKRITKIGRTIRKTSLDEIPQLINVLKGDMSIVGPRPLLPEYLNLYSNEQSRRHEVKPGITGWAQVNGRNAITWQEKFKLDVWYVDNQSFRLDWKIMVMTISKIFKSDGISQANQATTTRFEGNG